MSCARPTVPGLTLIRFLQETGSELDELREKIADACMGLPNDGSRAVQIQGVNLIVMNRNGADLVMVSHAAGPALVKTGGAG